MIFNNQKGMSLIEVTVAMLILGVVTVPLLQMFVNGSIFTLNARQEVAALNFAQEIMEEIKSIPDSQMGTAQGVGSNTITLENEASRNNDAYKDYMIVAGEPGTCQVRLIASYDGQSRTATLDQSWSDPLPVSGSSTYIIFKSVEGSYDFTVDVQSGSLNLKTVTVTVFYTVKDQNKEVSLTTEKLER